MTRPTSPWKVALPAALCTVGIFLLLPLVDLLSRKGANRIRVLPVDALRVSAPPPTVSARPPVRPQPKTVRPPLPQLAPRLRQLPVRALLQMQLAAPARGGRFGAGFALSDEAGPDLGGLVFTLNELDQAPVPWLRADPVYPPRARADRLEGEVELEFVVTATGDVNRVEVVASRPGAVFNAAAVSAVEGWTFKPGMRDGKPVAVRVRQKVSFNLQR